MNKLFMNTPTTRTTLAAAFAAAAIGATLPASASDFTVTSTTNRFIVTRTGEGINSAETVRYRTVSQSAYAGQHFTSQSGTLTYDNGKYSVHTCDNISKTIPALVIFQIRKSSLVLIFLMIVSKEFIFGDIIVVRTIPEFLTHQCPGSIKTADLRDTGDSDFVPTGLAL